MTSNRVPQDSITLQNLQPGDILTWVIYGTRHIAIYSPVEGQQGDLAHMFYNARGECAGFKSTLSQPLRNLKTGEDITVIRSRTKDEGTAIAAQAEFWIEHGVNYDFNRLGQVIYNHNHDVPEPSVEENIRQYLKYTTRRQTMPIKSQEYPMLQMNRKTILGLYMLNSMFSCDPIPSLGLKLLDYSTYSPNRSKGFNCIGFIAAAIAAVKFKKVIGTVTSETGWLSMKDLESLMARDPLQPFSMEKLAELLTPAIANTHPHLTHSEVFFKNLLDDKEHWQCMGVLDKKSELKPFNKAAYDAENQNLRTKIRDNHAQFIADFKMGIFTKKSEQQPDDSHSDEMQHYIRSTFM